MLRLALLLGALVFVSALAGCASTGGRPRSDASAGAPATGTPPDAAAVKGSSGDVHTSLEAFVAARQAAQRVPLSAVFAAPTPGVSQAFFITVAPAAQEVALADAVTAYSRAGSSLAVAQRGGMLRIVGPESCHALQLPGGKDAVALALAPQAGRLAALETGNQTIRLYDLRSCGEIATLKPPTPVSSMALAPDGQYLAYADAAYGLWWSPAVPAPGQEFVNLARLRFIIMDVGFSPRGGLLVATDQVGWITVWQLPDGAQIKTLRLPGGPFQQVEVLEGRVEARTVQGAPVALDLGSGAAVQPTSQKDALTVRDEVLFHAAPGERLSRSMTPARSPMRAWVAGDVITLQDVDGVRRAYRTDGTPAQLPAPGREGQPAELRPDYSFTAGGATVQAAFPLFAAQGMTLYCRHVGPDRHVLWWASGVHPAAATTPPAGLPRLERAFAPAPAAWIPLD